MKRPGLHPKIDEQGKRLLQAQISKSVRLPPSRIPDRTVFEKLVEVLVFGCAYERIADASCSESTLRRRRDEWIELGVM